MACPSDITWLPAAPPARDPSSIASILRWVTATHMAALRAQSDADFSRARDTALDTARAMGATRDQTTDAMRRATR